MNSDFSDLLKLMDQFQVKFLVRLSDLRRRRVGQARFERRPTRILAES